MEIQAEGLCCPGLYNIDAVIIISTKTTGIQQLTLLRPQINGNIEERAVLSYRDIRERAILHGSKAGDQEGELLEIPEDWNGPAIT